jgi:hypothetical protein
VLQRLHSSQEKDPSAAGFMCTVKMDGHILLCSVSISVIVGFLLGKEGSELLEELMFLPSVQVKELPFANSSLLLFSILAAPQSSS